MSHIEVHLYESDNSTHLAVLEEAFDVRYGDVLNGVGAGEFSIPLALPFQLVDTTAFRLLFATDEYALINAREFLVAQSGTAAIDKASLIEGGQIARFRVENEDVGAIVIEHLETPDLLQERVLKCSGRTLLALFERGIVYPSDLADYATMEKAYSAKTFAYIIIDLAAAAVARGVALPSDDFDAANDSDGVAFVDSNTVNYRGGTSLLDVILEHAELGIEVTISPEGVLHYYKAGGAGQDRSATVVFREGMNVISAGRTEEHRDLANLVLGDGQAILSAQSDATSIAAYGRRERLAQYGNVPNATTLATLATQSLANWKNPQTSIRLLVSPDTQMPGGYGTTAATLPFIDYNLGDTVAVILDSAGLGTTYRVRGISLAGYGDNLVAELTLNALMDDYLLQVDQALRRKLLSPLRSIVSGATNV